MKKLFTLLTMLIVAIGTSWAAVDIVPSFVKSNTANYAYKTSVAGFGNFYFASRSTTSENTPTSHTNYRTPKGNFVFELTMPSKVDVTFYSTSNRNVKVGLYTMDETTFQVWENAAGTSTNMVTWLIAHKTEMAADGETTLEAYYSDKLKQSSGTIASGSDNEKALMPEATSTAEGLNDYAKNLYTKYWYPSDATAISANSSSVVNVDGGNVIPAGKYIMTIGDSGSNVGIEKITITPAGAVTPSFELSNNIIGTNGTSQIRVVGKEDLDGIEFDGDVTFGTEGVVSVNATGIVTPLVAGTTTINFDTKAKTGVYNATTNQSVTITVKGASDLALSTSAADIDVNKSSDVTYTTSSTGEVYVSSSANDVATASVNESTKTITINAIAAGAATITVSQEGDDTHVAGSKTISVVVTNPAEGTVIYNWNTIGTTTLAGSAESTNVTVKGKSTASVKFGNGLSDTNYMKIEPKAGETFKAGDVFTFTGVISNSNSSKDGAITIATATSGSDIYLLTCSEKFANVYNDATVEPTSDSYVLTEDIDGALYIGRANTGLSSATATYMLSLTVTRPTTESVTIGKGGFSTFAGEYNYTVSGAKALAAQNKNTSVGFTEIPSETVIPANTGVVLQGTEGDEVTITYTTADAGTVTTDMVGVTEANPFVASTNVYVIATKTAGTKFYKYTGSTFPLGKAYLNAAVNAGDALDIVFDGATAVEAIAEANANSATPVKVIKNGKLYIGNYNVAGQLVK